MLVLTTAERTFTSFHFDTMSTLLPESDRIVPNKHRNALAAARPFAT